MDIVEISCLALTSLSSIEDDLVVTRDGSVNLTDVPKDPDELEAIISNTSMAAER